jgi:hypothetical protein
MLHIVPVDRPEPPRQPDPMLWRFLKGPWLGPVLLILGWPPLFVTAIVIDILVARGSVGPHFGAEYAMGWGTAVAFPASIVAVCSMILHSVRGVYRLLIRR